MNWHEYFTYNAETGDLIWKERPRSRFNSDQSYKAWNNRFANAIAGSRQLNRYGLKNKIALRCEGINYANHRIIWEMHYGPLAAELVIDHINRDPWDNRLSNIRACERRQNCMNIIGGRKNKHGYHGVSMCSRTGKYIATIRSGGKCLYIGTFDTPYDAHVAFREKSLILRGEFSAYHNTTAS